MITLMQKALAYFGRKEGENHFQRLSRMIHKNSSKMMKKMLPVNVVRTYPDGRKELMVMRLYKGKFRIPEMYVKEYKKGTYQLIDGTTLQVTKQKKSKGILGFKAVVWEIDEL